MNARQFLELDESQFYSLMWNSKKDNILSIPNAENASFYNDVSMLPQQQVAGSVKCTSPFHFWIPIFFVQRNGKG